MKKNIIAAALALSSVMASPAGFDEIPKDEYQITPPEPKPVVLIINGAEESNISVDLIDKSDDENQIYILDVQEKEDKPDPELMRENDIPMKEDNAPIKSHEVSQVEIEMLACVIYCEAGGDNVCDTTRYYVADVVLNRIDSDLFPNSMWEVLTEKGAYGLYYWTDVVWPEYSYSIWEQPAIERAYRIATDILVNGNHSWLYGEGYIWQSEYQQSEDSFYIDGFWFGR